MAGPIRISVLADVGAAQSSIRAVGQETAAAGATAETAGGRMDSSFSKVGQAALGLNAAIDTVSSALSAMDTVQNHSKTTARELARNQIAVEQAMADQRQKAIDLKQATQDLTQAQLDGKQAAVDVAQAQLDQRQATLDVATAQTDYATAVKEHGKNSTEAKQAELDLAQAQLDLKQATQDVSQAQADQSQSAIDVTQATEDGKQAALDARSAALDLAEAQDKIRPTGIQQAMKAFEQLAPVMALSALAVQAFTGTAIAAKVATLAGSAATGIATAAQWLWNVALSANPIGLVVLAIAALIAAIVLLWQNSETFRSIVTGSFSAVWAAVQAGWSWISSHWPLLLSILTGPIGAAVIYIVRHWEQVKSTISALPGQIQGWFGGVGNLLADAGRRIIGGLIDGIKGQFGAVRGLLGQLTDMLPDWKGPAGKDAKLLYGAGQLVIGGFQSGLESGYGGVQSSLGDLTGGIAASGAVTVSPAQAPAWAQRLTALLDGGLTITIDSSGRRGDDAILELIRGRVVAKGGRAAVLGITA